MKMIHSFKEMGEKIKFDCRIRALKENMNHYGLDINLYIMMALCESLTFQYGRLNFKGFPVQNVPFAFATENDIEYIFFRSFNLRYCVEKIDDSEAGWNRMKDFIDNDVPLLVKIDGTYINRILKSQDAVIPDVKVGYLSTLLLVGYEDESEVGSFVYTTDVYKDGKLAPFELSRFQKCRNSICYPYAPEFECMYFQNDSNIEHIHDTFIDACILKGLMNISRKMLNESKEKGISKEGFECKNIQSGIPAMRLMKEDLSSFEDLYQLNKNKSNKLFSFFAQFLRANLSLGGRTAFRYEFGLCLKECAVRFQDEIFHKLGEKFIDISIMWKAFIFELTKIVNEKDVRDNWKNAIQKFDIIIEHEKNEFYKLYCLLNKSNYVTM